ncbi:hypothetical protein SAMN06295912_10170 [Sphingomonas laterariae]|uniref:Uncharacterized protein n=1 Tax=Edaphosphingomonas laterariae TaxID=861865 RepID=A0A239BF15_9SPHN|nr:hypothetical protein [Sphingomonas laterariae]SNS05633.1 hypothetical protein SAMN06295912_10170 [Sphingomonas laterariae]
MQGLSIGLLASLGAGMAMGLAGGAFAVRGVAPDYIRMADGRSDTLGPWRGRYAAETRVADPSEYGPSVRDVGYDPVAANCPGCSDYEIGYRWAASGAASTTADCEAYSWSYERGCIAWLRDRGNNGT